MKPGSTNQHYVPQFLLRNFASGRGNRIFVFDKTNRKTFPASIQKVAAARGFYDCEVDGIAQSIDPLITKMERAASNIIRKIVGGRSLSDLGDTQRAMIALFTSVQKLRTEARRAELKALMADFHDAVKRAGWDPDKVNGFEFLDEEETRVHTITSLGQLARELMPGFLDKTWILFGSSYEHPFYISDNPVTLFNSNQDLVRSTLGIGVPGIEIYLPLSSTLCLGFLCPTIETTIRGSYDLAKTLGHPVPPEVHALICAIDREAAVALDPSNIMHHNSLQVCSAERFVFSGSDDFSLAREMLRQLPELKGGPRLS